MIGHYLDLAVVVASRTGSLIVVLVASTANVAAAVWLLATDVDPGLLTAAFVIVCGIGSGIAGWALVMLVGLSRIVARLEAKVEDMDSRLERADL